MQDLKNNTFSHHKYFKNVVTAANCSDQSTSITPWTVHFINHGVFKAHRNLQRRTCDAENSDIH